MPLNRYPFFILMLLSLLLSACATTGTYVAGDVAHVETVNSDRHQFKYVNVSVDEGQDAIVVYGKLSHPHQGSQSDAQVYLCAINTEGDELFRQKLAMRHQSNHLKGWRGAGFRDTISAERLQNATIRLCIEDVTYSQN
jgi:hypothetical protein